MAGTEQDIRRELSDERQQLAVAVESLRTSARAKVPYMIAGGVLFLFVVSGAMRMTVRMTFRMLRR